MKRELLILSCAAVVGLSAMLVSDRFDLGRAYSDQAASTSAVYLVMGSAGNVAAP